jgi:hypothetical protein
MATAAAKRTAVQPYSKITPVSSDFWGKPVYRDAKGVLLCPGYTGNNYSLSPWDTLQITLEGPFDEFETKFAKQQTPGIIQSINASKGLSVDEKKAAGGNNARLTVHGYELAKVEIHVKLWTPMQWELMKKLWARIQPVGGKTLPGAFNIYHPELNAHKITAIQFLRGEGPMPGPQPGTRIFMIHAAEFNLPSKSSVTKTDEAPKPSLLDAPTSQPPGKNPKNTAP